MALNVYINQMKTPLKLLIVIFRFHQDLLFFSHNVILGIEFRTVNVSLYIRKMGLRFIKYSNYSRCYM